MDTFNLPACAAVGEIKAKIKDAILDGVIPNEYEAAYAYMLKIGKEIILPSKCSKFRTISDFFQKLNHDKVMWTKRITGLFDYQHVILSANSRTRQTYITLDYSRMSGDKYMISNFTAQLITLLNDRDEVCVDYERCSEKNIRHAWCL